MLAFASSIYILMLVALLLLLPREELLVALLLLLPRGKLLLLLVLLVLVVAPGLESLVNTRGGSPLGP